MTSSHPVRPTLWRTCRVLANTRRLQIFALLVRESWLTVSAVAGRLKLSLPATSLSLRGMEARGLLQLRRSGRYVKYRLASASGEAATDLVVALRDALTGAGDNLPDLFKLLTAFTHPRRVELVRALASGPKSPLQLYAATRIPSRALSRHLRKLQSRGLVVLHARAYALAKPPNALAATMLNLAKE